MLLAAKGDAAAAEPLFREVLKARRELLGDEHEDTQDAANALQELLGVAPAAAP